MLNTKYYRMKTAIKKCEIYLLLRNYKSTTEKIDINLISDRNWEISDNSFFSIILPNQCSCINISVRKKFNDGIEELSFLFKTNESEHIIDINGIQLSNCFESEFIGKQHKNIVNKLTQSICSENYMVRYIIGEAGTGKTRIIDEIQKELSGKNISILRILCTNNENLVKKRICKFLINESFVQEVSYNDDLIKTLKSINTSYKKCLLILDDFHNLTNMLEMIKDLFTIKMPEKLKIIFVGRNDYSVGNIKYYNFISFCENNEAIKGYRLLCMDDKDTSKFIRSIIPDIPEIIFSKVKEMCNNNPLFIIQFIEYLLEINLAVIVNRSFISICNLDAFSSLTYIPSKIEDVYKKRCKNLSSDNEHKECLEFLYIFAMLGIQIPQYKIICFFENKQEKLDVLVKRKYI